MQRLVRLSQIDYQFNRYGKRKMDGLKSTITWGLQAYTTLDKITFHFKHCREYKDMQKHIKLQWSGNKYSTPDRNQRSVMTTQIEVFSLSWIECNLLNLIHLLGSIAKMNFKKSPAIFVVHAKLSYSATMLIWNWWEFVDVLATKTKVAWKTALVKVHLWNFAAGESVIEFWCRFGLLSPIVVNRTWSTTVYFAWPLTLDLHVLFLIANSQQHSLKRKNNTWQW